LQGCFNPNNSSAGPYWQLIQKVAKFIEIIPVSFPVHDAASIQDAIDAFVREPNGGMVLPTDVTTTAYRDFALELFTRCKRVGLPMRYKIECFTRLLWVGGWYR
jgi:hypothetical protein